jgi:hypothetical protein
MLWDSEGSAMPEIVELHVTLRSEDNICDEGIAHLVFFGSHKEDGIITMDLPIKKKSQANPDSPSDLPDHPLLSFESDAYVRVQVEIRSETSERLACADIFELSDNLDEKKIGGIMEQLREHEEMAAARAKAAKLEFRDEDAGKHRSFSKFFSCSSGVEFKQSIQAVFDAFRKCDSGKPWKGKQYDHGSILQMNSTMETTIATRDSLGI